jgi:hypothetical protein
LILGLSVGLWGCAKDTTTATTPPTVPSGSADSSASGGAASSTSRDTSASTSTQTTQSTAGQSADRSASADRPERGAQSSAAEASITGCLAKGDTAETYVLTEEKTEAKTTVQGSADLEKHVSHKVTLFGTKGDGAHPMFQVTRIQHVATSCTP